MLSGGGVWPLSFCRIKRAQRGVVPCPKYEGGIPTPSPKPERGYPAHHTPPLVKDRVPPPPLLHVPCHDFRWSHDAEPFVLTGTRRGGTPHSKVREGVPYPPSPKSEGGTPSPLVLRKTGYLPPSGCMYPATASHRVTPEMVFCGWSSGRGDTPSLPYEWGVPPPPLQNMRGGYLRTLPPLQ